MVIQHSAATKGLDADVSVVIPAFNAESTIDEAIDSLRAQQFSGKMLILVVDDGSTDSTLSRIIRHCKEDSRVGYIATARSKHHSGVAHARNAGISSVTGRYIAFLDADDIAEPHRLQRQYDFMESHPEFALTGSAVRFFGSEDRVVVPSLDPDETAIRMMFSCEFFMPTLMVRSGFMRKHQIYFDQFWGANCDWEWVLRLMRAGGRMANLPEPLVRYRRWEHQMTATIVDTPHCLASMLRLDHLCWLGVSPGQCDMETHIATARCHWPIRIVVREDEITRERVMKWMRTIAGANLITRRLDDAILRTWLKRIAADWTGNAALPACAAALQE